MKVFYDDDCWKVEGCPDEPTKRIHIYNHLNPDFPECWSIDGVISLTMALAESLSLWEKEQS